VTWWCDNCGEIKHECPRILCAPCALAGVKLNQPQERSTRPMKVIKPRRLGPNALKIVYGRPTYIPPDR